MCHIIAHTPALRLNESIPASTGLFPHQLPPSGLPQFYRNNLCHACPPNSSISLWSVEGYNGFAPIRPTCSHSFYNLHHRHASQHTSLSSPYLVPILPHLSLLIGQDSHLTSLTTYSFTISLTGLVGRQRIAPKELYVTFGNIVCIFESFALY